MPKPAALEVVIKFLTDMSGQALALLAQLVKQSRVVLFDEFIKQRLFGTVALVSNITQDPPLMSRVIFIRTRRLSCVRHPSRGRRRCAA